MKNRYYLTTYGLCWPNCSGLCDASLLFKGQWRKKWMADSKPLPQFHIGLTESWKLCLNLCSRRCLRPSRIRVIHLIAIGLWQSKNELEEGRMNFNMLLLICYYCSYRIFVDWGLICFIQLYLKVRKNFWKNCVRFQKLAIEIRSLK